MGIEEPQATALLLATCGVLLGISVVFGRASLPAFLVLAVLLLAFSSLLHAWGSAGAYTLIAESLPEEGDRVNGYAILSTFTQAAVVVGPALAGGLVGSRLYYIVENYDQVKDDLLGNLFSGSGLVWYGGLLGGDEPVDVSEPEESAHPVHHRVDRRVRQPGLGQVPHVELHMRPLDSDQGV